MPSTRATAVVARLVASALTGIGVVLTVVGTFLPWFFSGAVTRNSYEAAGLVERFDLAGGAEQALAGWAAVPLLAAVCAAALVTRFVRTAAAACLILSLAVGTVGVLVAVQAGDHDGLIGIDRTGPVVTALGAGLAFVAALAAVALAGRAAGPRPPRAAATAGAGTPPRHR
ncbi:hypothetical protein FHS23_002076 [Prauserella isguenensis]|uniref:Uncharacterized protein n=1 Tax=Prauserella isguenensis TaxID=1470180 RepID=A0A839S161_9PSEU|nr:hypothetical protein [Prauserella isguenensis]MBB3051053.1 hypothetical protein [Prauserella isguenensis]